MTSAEYMEKKEADAQQNKDVEMRKESLDFVDTDTMKGEESHPE